MTSIVDRAPPRSVAPETKVVVGLISGSHFVNHMYLVLLPPILGVLAGEFDASLTALGIAVGALGLFNTIFQIPFGYLSDNYSRSVTLFVGLVLGSLGTFVLAFAPSFAWLVVGQAIVGTGIAAHHPAHFPMLSDATPESSRGKAFSVHGFCGNIGYAASPAIITTVLAVPGLTWRHAFVFMGAIGTVYAALSLAVLSWRVSGEVTAPGDQDSEAEYSLSSIRERIAAEARSLLTAPAILALAVLSLVTAMASWGIRAYAVVLLTDGYALGLSTANTVLTVMFVAGATLVLVGGELSDRMAPGWILVTSYAVVAVAAAVVATLVLPPVVAMVAVVVGGGAFLLGVPAKNKLTDALSMRSDLGKNFAVITIGVAVGGSIAPPLFGAIIDATGVGTAFYTVAGFAVLGGIIVLGILQTYRDATGAVPTPGTGDD